MNVLFYDKQWFLPLTSFPNLIESMAKRIPMVYVRPAGWRKLIGLFKECLN